MAGEGEIDWGTVERSDGPLHDTTVNEYTDVQEVPENIGDVIAELDSGNYNQPHQDSTDEPQKQVQRGDPGSLVECDNCGKQVRVRKDGYLSTHKCDTKAQRGNRLDTLPDSRQTAPTRVRGFAIGIIAYAVEEGSAHLLARPYAIDPDLVPTDLPDAEGMIGAPVDAIWPVIPRGAQKFIEACADNADLIDAALSWWDWYRGLSKWVKEQNEVKRQFTRQRQETHSGEAVFAGTSDDYGRLIPFQPA